MVTSGRVKVVQTGQVASGGGCFIFCSCCAIVWVQLLGLIMSIAFLVLKPEASVSADVCRSFKTCSKMILEFKIYILNET